jgi:hypothetical protein
VGGDGGPAFGAVAEPRGRVRVEQAANQARGVAVAVAPTKG